MDLAESKLTVGQCKHSDMNPVPGVEYSVLLGNTVLANDEPYSYISMRYDFKPASAMGQHASGVYSRREEQVLLPPPPPTLPPSLREGFFHGLRSQSCYPSPDCTTATWSAKNSKRSPFAAGDLPDAECAYGRRSNDFQRPLRGTKGRVRLHRRLRRHQLHVGAHRRPREEPQARLSLCSLPSL